MLYGIPNPHGGDIYTQPVRLDFSANTNPFGTPAAIQAAVAEALPQMHRYPDPCCRTLVQAISDYEQVPPSCILCGNGAADLIYSYCQALKPRLAAELAPTFSEYSLGLQQVGSRIQRYFLHPETEFALTADFLLWVQEQKPDVIFLCNPNNPTGRLIDPGLLDQLLLLTRQLGISLFVDECFLDLTDDGISLKDRLQSNPQLFLLKAFTKSYGMAGIRLGYGLCADSALLTKLSAAGQPWNVSSLAQAAGIAALRQQAFLKTTRELIRTQRQYLAEGLGRFGFRVFPSSANYLLFQGPETLHTQLKALGIAIRNCDNYQGLGAGWYRIAVRLPEENEELLAAISRIVERNSEWQKIL